MSGFDAAWLALREPADRRARTAELATQLARWLEARGRETLRITDLGCGTGANVRFLAPLLPPAQAWTCIDDEPQVLRIAAAQRWPGVAVECRRLDLVTRLDEALRPGADVITASALLDLVSRAWLERLLAVAVRARAALLFALNYDGSMAFAPVHAFDARVRELFNEHQVRDKGFGPALGPGASAAVELGLASAGYALQTRPSAWQLDAREADAAALLAPLLTGIAAAAREQGADDGQMDRWLTSRLAASAAGELRVTIGHRDVLALPLN